LTTFKSGAIGQIYHLLKLCLSPKTPRYLFLSYRSVNPYFLFVCFSRPDAFIGPAAGPSGLGLALRSPICQSLLCLDLLSSPVLSQTKPQAPTPGGALPSIPLSFSLATRLPPEPKGLISHKVLRESGPAIWRELGGAPKARGPQATSSLIAPRSQVFTCSGPRVDRCSNPLSRDPPRSPQGEVF